MVSSAQVVMFIKMLCNPPNCSRRNQQQDPRTWSPICCPSSEVHKLSDLNSFFSPSSLTFSEMQNILMSVTYRNWVKSSNVWEKDLSRTRIILTLLIAICNSQIPSIWDWGQATFYTLQNFVSSCVKPKSQYLMWPCSHLLQSPCSVLFFPKNQLVIDVFTSWLGMSSL
jgi:hypothetical protein